MSLKLTILNAKNNNLNPNKKAPTGAFLISNCLNFAL